MIRSFIPAVSVVLATLLAALPWGLSSDNRFLLPMLPYAAIHLWAVRRPTLMPEWLAFSSGLATDVLTHGPLGFWSLVFLLGLMFVQACRPGERWGAAGRWLHFAATLGLLALAQWLIATLYFVSVVDWRPFLNGALLAAFAYPLLSLAFGPLEHLWPATRHGRFDRGE
jgi:rod shape-determining protein MreD